MTPTLLVTTALDETYVEGRDALLLGEWCKLYSRRSDWARRQHRVLPYHWDVPGKREADYHYLETLVGPMMAALAEDLNTCHGIDRPVRYWRIVLGSWLSMYVAALYDRWESLRLAFDGNTPFETVVYRPRGAVDPPLGSMEQVVRAVSDWYNHDLFADIIDFSYADRCGVIAIDRPPVDGQRDSSQTPPSRARRRSTLRRLARAGYRLFSQLQNGNDVVIVNSYFRLGALARLSLRLGQLPRLYHEFGQVVDTRLSHAGQLHPLRVRFRDLVGRQASRADGFHGFCWKRIAMDLPWSHLEGLDDIRSQAQRMPLKCRTIVTANAHWHNEFFKVWSAERVIEGTKLVTAEHGGSFPALGLALNFEENMADVHVPTFREHHPKHRQLAPTKYIGRTQPRNRRRECVTVVTFDGPRYAIRAAGQPHSTQALRCFEQCVTFCESLPSDVREYVRLKLLPPDPLLDWDLRARCCDRLGARHVLPDMPLPRAFELSKIIVCTYPQSTFTEAMLTGLPTVMFFDPAIHQLHPVTASVVRALTAARVIFNDPVAAADHIAEIWANPERWWSSEAVFRAREMFMSATMNGCPRPLRGWVRLLREMTTAAQLASSLATVREQW